MNYLAHLYLAEDSPESILGNLLGDFLKGQKVENYSQEIQKGINLHRKVDSYTDSHPVVKQSKALISAPNRRYAGVLVDIFYDHFLAKNWSTYSSIPLQKFATQVYIIFQSNESVLPPKMQLVLPRIINNNLLVSYRELAGIQQALQNISARLKRKNTLGEAIEELSHNYQQLELDFKNFFPDLINYVQLLK
jgi:acyl carrier protein phosphodiesterase